MDPGQVTTQVTGRTGHSAQRVEARKFCSSDPRACLGPYALGCRRFSSRTPSVFLSLFTTPSLFLSIFPGKLRGNRQILGSEPSLRLWFGPKISQILGQIGKMPGISRRTRVYLEITLRPPGYFVDFLNFASDFAPDQLSDSGKLVSRMEHQTPSVSPGNFRKRKVLGTLCFPFCFPENLVACLRGKVIRAKPRPQ